MHNPSNIFWIILSWYILFVFQNAIPWKKEFHSPKTDIAKNLIATIILCLPLVLFHRNWSHVVAWPQFQAPAQKIILVLLATATVIVAWRHASKMSKISGLLPDATFSQTIFYLATRAIFVVVYECFFRGLLLFCFIYAFDVATAVVVNIFLYVLAHISKKRSEIIACIPFGLVLCGITIWHRSVLPAVALHLALAMVHETWLICFANPSPKIQHI